MKEKYRHVCFAKSTMWINTVVLLLNFRVLILYFQFVNVQFRGKMFLYITIHCIHLLNVFVNFHTTS